MQKNKAFTLIELLVVIAVIGLLTTVVLVSLSGIKADGRDAKRQQDLKNIALAMEVYNGTEGSYLPTTAGTNTVSSIGTYLSQLPTDPTGGDLQYTWTESDGSYYCLYSKLEGVDNTYYCASNLGNGIKTEADYTPSNTDCCGYVLAVEEESGSSDPVPDENLTQVAESESYSDYPRRIAMDQDYLYANIWLTQRIKKIQKSNLSEVTESVDLGGNILAVASDGDYVYVSVSTIKKVKKLRKSDLVEVAQSASYSSNINSIAFDENYVYIGGGDKILVKLQKSDLSKISQSADLGGRIEANGIIVDQEYIYASFYIWEGGDRFPVRKFRKSDFTEIAESESYGYIISQISSDENYIYVVGSHNLPGVETRTVRKYQKSDLSKVTESIDFGGNIYGIDVEENDVYIVLTSPVNTVKKLQKSDFLQTAESANLGGGVVNVNSDEDYLYVGVVTVNKIKKLQKFLPE